MSCTATVLESMYSNRYLHPPDPPMVFHNSIYHLQVDVFNTDLIKCNAEANILRDDFKWLLLFTSSNLKQLAELLKQLLLSDSNITVITREVRRKVASLFPRNLYQEPRFISAIEVGLHSAYGLSRLHLYIG